MSKIECRNRIIYGTYNIPSWGKMVDSQLLLISLDKRYFTESVLNRL
jgi:hypothetical protein